MDRQAEYVLRTVEERGIRFIRLWFTDVQGFLKAVARISNLNEPPIIPGAVAAVKQGQLASSCY